MFIMNPENIFSSGPVVFGDRVSFTSEFRDGYLEIADDVEIGSDCSLDFSGGLKLGNRVHISSEVVIYTHTATV